MKVAFYAPMKAPTHPVPSGDRKVARLLMSALRGAGYQVELASRLRAYDATGDARRQKQIARRAERSVATLLASYSELPARRPDVWFTYHLYHKAPDWIGPCVSARLHIPYVVAEASHAPRQADGPWRCAHRASLAAMVSATHVVCMNPRDRPALEALGIAPQRLSNLPPFVDCRSLQHLAATTPIDDLRCKLRPDVPVLVTVAMMRAGDKFASYCALAKALRRLEARSWQLVVIGAGALEAEVKAQFAAFGPRVIFMGEQSEARVAAMVRHADLFVWPACNEAWGMVFIEAAALGVTAVAGDSGGVASVIDHNRSGLLVPLGNPRAFAGAIAELIDNRERRQAMADTAKRQAWQRHDLPAAQALLRHVLEQALAS